MKKLTLLVVVFVAIGSFLAFSQKDQLSVKKELVATPTPIATQTVKPGVPQTLIIPTLNVKVLVEEVGLDREKRMAVPSNFVNTGWYKYGPRPGDIGNSVIDGHFDTPTGAPSVFWDLKNMQKGDQIKVLDSKGKEYVFEVVKTSSFPDKGFPIDIVFGKTDKKMLNLITCSGTWDKASGSYSERVVVFSELIQ